MNVGKIAGASIGALVVAWAGASYYVGGAAEEVFRNIEAQTADGKAVPYLDVTLNEFDRGWFSSKVTMTVEVNFDYLKGMFEASEEPEILDKLDLGAFTFSATLDHGPLLWGPDGLSIGAVSFEEHLAPKDFLKDNEDWADAVQKLGLPAGYELYTWIEMDLGGNGSISQSMAPFTSHVVNDDGDVLDIEWGGYRTDLEIGSGLGYARGEYSIPSLKINITKEGETQSLEMSGIEITLDMVREAPYIWLGTTNLGLATLAIENSGNDDKTMHMDGIAYEIEYTSEGPDHPLNMFFGMSLENLSGNAFEEVLPNFDASFDLDMEINNISKEFLAGYYEIIYDAEPDMEEMGEQLMPLIAGMAAANPEINITKGLIAFGGGTMNYTQELRIDSSAGMPEDQEGWLAAIVYRGTIVADETMARLIAKQTLISQLGENAANVSEEQLEQGIQNTITQMMTTGMVTKDGEGYRVDMAIDNGIFSIAGNPVVDLRTQLPGGGTD